MAESEAAGEAKNFGEAIAHVIGLKSKKDTKIPDQPSRDELKTSM